MEDRQKEQETKEEKAADEEEIVCLESGETSRRPPSSSDQPPEWFYRWMDKVFHTVFHLPQPEIIPPKYLTWTLVYLLQ